MSEKERNYNTTFYNILTPILGMTLGAVILVVGYWSVLFGIHFFLTGHLMEPAVRIIKIDKRPPVQNTDDSSNQSISTENTIETTYQVEYKTYSNAFWRTVCYRYCTVESYEEARERAIWTKYLINKTGGPYTDEYPKFGRIETQTVIPFKGEK